jgi:hypothetical protein
MIEMLPTLTPDASRGAKVLARCHDRLARQRRRAAQRVRGGRIERTLMTGFAVIYVAAVTANALSVFSMF